MTTWPGSNLIAYAEKNNRSCAFFWRMSTWPFIFSRKTSIFRAKTRFSSKKSHMTLCKSLPSSRNRHLTCRFSKENGHLHRVMCYFFEENRVFVLKMLIFLEKWQVMCSFFEKKAHDLSFFSAYAIKMEPGHVVMCYSENSWYRYDYARNAHDHIINKK